MAKFGLFGFKLGKDNQTQEVLPSFSPPVLDDGAVTITAAAHYGTSIDLDSNYKNDVELITRYREMAMQPEIESAVDDIINEAIIYQDGKCVQLNLDAVKTSPKVKKAIEEEFNTILTLLNFKQLGQDIFRRYYVDGRLFYNIILDKDSPNTGIQELRYIDPRKLSKIREIQKVKDKTTGFDIVQGYTEYYIYSDTISTKSNLTNSGLRIAPDSIISITSGLLDAKRSIVLSYLHKCIEENQRVRTTSGWKAIKDITTDDVIYSYDYINNKLIEAKVKHIWETGIKKITKVRSRHATLLCTDDHLILVKDSNDIISYKQAKDIDVKKDKIKLEKSYSTGIDIKFPVLDRAIVSKVTNTDVWKQLEFKGKKKFIFSIAEKYNLNKHKVYSFIYGVQPLEHELAKQIISEFPIEFVLEQKYEGYWQNNINIPEYVDEDFARLFGFLLGDGWVNKNTISFAEGIYEDENEYYSDLLRKYFGNCTRIVSKSNPSNYHTRTSNNTLGSELLKKMGFETGAKNKRIPTWVFEATPTIQMAVLKGFHDADGYNRENEGETWQSSINICNENLIKDIKELWTTLGYCSGNISKKISDGYTSYGVFYKKQVESYSIFLSEKPLPEWECVLSVSDTDDYSPVYDIEVDNEVHNFVVNNVVVHNCIKPLNQLRMIEDATVIYKVSRAPERRIFYIDVGNLPKMKAEQYLKDIMSKYKNKVVYDATTGLVQDDRRHLSMMDDFWLPRRSDNKSTEITTLPSSAAFDDMSMVQYFEKKLYKALNVPYSRIENPDNPFDMGDNQVISRDEIKFDKFINRIRLKFTDLFDQALKVQCILKGVCTDSEFDTFKQDIIYDFIKDNNYAELLESQLLQNRLAMLATVDMYKGVYYSAAWIRKNILQQDDELVEQMKKEIMAEIESGEYADPRMINDPTMMNNVTDTQVPDESNVTPETPDTTQDSTTVNTKQGSNPYYE